MMGIYSDWAEQYFESGLFCIPCNERKAPAIGAKWQSYCDTSPTLDDIKKWSKDFHYSERLGLLLGKASGVVAFDFDYEWSEDAKHKIPISKEEFDEDKALVEKQVMALLPDTPCIKVGAKGWTRFYKWNESHANKCLDRNGVRMFDFLAWHKQTIIPPSLHSINKKTGSAIHYRWIDESLEDCINKLPELSMDTVDNIASLFDKGDSETKFNHRHGRIFIYVHDLLDIEKNEDKIIASAIAYDKKVNSPPYLEDKKHVGSSPKKYLEDWIHRIKRYKIVTNGKGKVKKVTNSKITWDYFFETSFMSFRKDILTDKIHVRPDDKSPWTAAIDIEGVLRSYASRKGLARSNVMDELERWSFEKKEKGLLVDFPEWDGVDRVRMFAEALKSPYFNSDEIYEILCDWGAKVFHRIHSKNSPVQNRCPIIKGGQGLGKDTWARNMLSGFGQYYQSVNLSGTQKDMLEVVSRLLIIHIEEFDQTANVPVAFLKDLITKPQVFFRESYGRSPAMRDMMASWISTANVDDVLRDPTGNRRFIVIPIDKIEWNYPQGQSPQVYAQFFDLYKRGVNYTSEATEERIKALLDEYTPDDVTASIIESYRDRIAKIASYQQRSEFRYSEIDEMLAEIAKNVGCPPRRVQSVLKSAGYQKRTGLHRMYCSEPKEFGPHTRKP